MDKDVVITIRSSSCVNGNEMDGMELITRGTYHYNRDRIGLSYLESALTGMEGTSTMLQVLPNEVLLQRKGSVCSQMVFHPGKWNDFLYQTEYGMLRLGMDTRRLECQLDEHGGSMEIEYDLDFENNFLSRNKFQIYVKEKELKS